MKLSVDYFSGRYFKYIYPAKPLYIHFMANARLIGRFILSALIFISLHLQAQTVTLPATGEDSLMNVKPVPIQVTLETGPLLCNEAEKFSGIDLDGPGNIYGETEIIHDGYFFNAGLKWGFKKGHDISGKYSLVKMNKSLEAKIGDTLSVDDQYPQFRHQFYISGTLNSGKGFKLQPAVHFLLDCYETVVPEQLVDPAGWIFPVEKFRTGTFIGYLAASKDFRYLQARVFTAFSNLNDKSQFQAGLQLVAYPFDNPNLVISSKFLDHRDDGNDNLVFEQAIGFRVSKHVSADVNATFGNMSNYYDNNASEVYDLYSKLTFKGAAKIIFEPAPRLKITGEYRYLAGEGSYMYYEMTGSGENSRVATVVSYRDFISQVYALGVSWSF